MTWHLLKASFIKKIFWRHEEHLLLLFSVLIIILRFRCKPSGACCSSLTGGVMWAFHRWDHFVSWMLHSGRCVYLLHKHSSALSSLAERESAKGALAMALHPWSDATLMEHVLTWRHENMLVRHECLQTDGAVLAACFLGSLHLYLVLRHASHTAEQAPSSGSLGWLVHLLL